MKWRENELRKKFATRIKNLEKQFNQAKSEPLMSEDREEIISIMAVSLRSLFCQDSSGTPLIVSAGFDQTVLFPLQSRMAPYNELRETLLVNYTINGNCCSFSSQDPFFKHNKVASSYLSYCNWINEIVIDIKQKGFPPLTRGEIIKIVADKEGAHLDVNYHPFTELLLSTNIMDIEVWNGGVICEAKCSNLLYETILAIAEEAIYSCKHLIRPIVRRQKLSSSILRVFDYSEGIKKRFKYAIGPTDINDYNTNRDFQCSIKHYPLYHSDILFGSRFFDVYIIEDRL